MKSSDTENKLQEYISVYDNKVQEIFFHLRNFASKNRPEANQLIYDSYNAVSVAFSLSDKLEDAFCHIALYKNHVNFGFNRGSEIQNPELKLEGSGKLIRHYKIHAVENIPEMQLAALLDKAIKISLANNPEPEEQRPRGRVFIRPSSGKKVRPSTIKK